MKTAIARNKGEKMIRQASTKNKSKQRFKKSGLSNLNDKYSSESDCQPDLFPALLVARQVLTFGPIQTPQPDPGQTNPRLPGFARGYPEASVRAYPRGSLYHDFVE